MQLACGGGELPRMLAGGLFTHRCEPDLNGDRLPRGIESPGWRDVPVIWLDALGVDFLRCPTIELRGSATACLNVQNQLPKAVESPKGGKSPTLVSARSFRRAILLFFDGDRSQEATTGRAVLSNRTHTQHSNHPHLTLIQPSPLWLLRYIYARA